jgi:hypothetical protein
MDDRIAHGEIEVLSYVRVKAHDVYKLISLAFPGLIL